LAKCVLLSTLFLRRALTHWHDQDSQAKSKLEHSVNKAEAKAQEGKDATKDYARKVEAYTDKKYEELKVR
jgi:hypothetical protein